MKKEGPNGPRKGLKGEASRNAHLMDDPRQKIQMELAFPPLKQGEALPGGDEGTEPSTAESEAESPANTDRLMEEVCEQENLKKALHQVQSNKGSPGVDGMTVQALAGYLKKQWPTLQSHLLKGTYQPQPVKRVDIPKPDGGTRKLGIPTVLDRLVQQAVMQVLQKRWDPTFSQHSYGFRPGRSAHQAVAQAQEYIAQGHGWVVDLDLEKFFDRVNHDILMGRVAKRITDKRMLRLLRTFLNAGVMMEDGLVSPTEEGTPQGGPLSPLLSNLLLDELDRELKSRALRFVRYADDCNIYVRSERAGHRVMEGVKRFLTLRLKLKVNETKSAVARPETRKFLGFSFTAGREPKRRIAPKALDRLKDRIREFTRRTRGASLRQIVESLARYLKGWKAYFGYCQTPSVLDYLDRWIRRRLRAVVWKHWKRGRTQYVRLRERGVGHTTAAQTAGSSHGPWRISASPALTRAFRKTDFLSLGLPSLYDPTA